MSSATCSRTPPTIEAFRAPRMRARIAVLPGDGIGPEVIAAGPEVSRRGRAPLRARLRAHRASLRRAAIEAHGDSAARAHPGGVPQRRCGAAGGDRRSASGRAPEARVRPEQGLLRLRAALGAFANLRPVRVHPALLDASTLRREVIEGVDLVFVRELTGGIYFGEKHRDAASASDLCSLHAVRRSSASCGWRRGWRARAAQRLTSIDKANVLETSRLWREVATRRHGRGVPRRGARAHAGGLGRHAPHPPAARFRRPRDREHVRRHPHR